MANKYENIFDSICRLCLNFNDRNKMIPLIDKSNPDGLTPYAKAVSTFAHISFTNNDCFPSNMCPKCLHLLKHAIQFKLAAEFSDKCLKQLKKQRGIECKNLKQNIIEFTMLKYYFPTEYLEVQRESSRNEEYSKNQSNNDSENDIFDVANIESDSEQNLWYGYDKMMEKELKIKKEEQSIEGNTTIQSIETEVDNYTEDNIFEAGDIESDSEQNLSHNEKILDKMDHLYSSKIREQCKDAISTTRNKQTKVDNVFEVGISEVESDTEHNLSNSFEKKLDKIDHLFNSNSCKTSIATKVFKRKDNQSKDTIIMEGIQQTNLDDDLEDIFGAPAVESNSEQHSSHNFDKVLDEIDHLISSNNCETPISAKVLKKKKKGPKNKVRTGRIHKLSVKYKSRQRMNLVCNVCDRVLANKLTYDNHMQRHTGCRYMCEHCGKGFPELHGLNLHQVARHGTGSYLQCTQCPFKAAKKFLLIEHERIHTGERPYSCDKCELTFRRKGLWKRHLVYHSEKKFQCPQCPRKFFKRYEILAHVNKIHNKVYCKYSCGECDATYASIKNVRRHMIRHHGITKEMQKKIMRVNKTADSDPEESS